MAGTAAAPLPTVTCIVIAHNEERYIGAALDSVMAQELRPTEILVVDDGSTDRTAEIAAAHPARPRVLRQNRAGPASARHRGADEAAGDLLAFLDADDTWRPEKLRLQVARFVARPELDVCTSHVTHVWESAERRAADTSLDPRLSAPMPSFGGSSWVVRRTSYFRIGPPRQEIHHASAIDWFVRARERGAAVELLPDVLATRRIRAGNTSRAYAADSRAEVLRIVKASLDRRRERLTDSPPG